MRQGKTKHTFFRVDPSAEQERNINKQMMEEMKSLGFHVIGFFKEAQILSLNFFI